MGEGQGRRRQALGEEGRGHGRRWPETEKAMVKLAGYLAGERKMNGKWSNVVDSIKGIHYGGENDEIYLVVVVVDARTRRFGRKSSSKVHWKPSFSELRRPICEAMSGDSKKRSYFWNQRV